VTGVSGTRVSWGSGSNVQAAFDRCRAGGFRCSDPIGGCVE
jgi:hypothetical protein